MNRLNDATLGMYKTVEAFLTANAATITAANVPKLTSYNTDLIAKIDAIRTTSGETSKKTQGITATKAEAEDEAIRQAVILAGWMYSYADDNGKTALKVDMAKITPAYLKVKKDEEVVDDLGLILLEAQEISNVTPPATNPLIPFGLKLDVGEEGDEDYEPGTLALLEEAIQVYAQLTTAPREAITVRKSYNEALENLYTETDALLVKMDKIVDGLQITFPPFYTGYKNAREVAGPMTLRSQIVGQVNKITNVALGTTAPVHGAKITVLMAPYVETQHGQVTQISADPIIVQTDAEGKYAVPTPKTKTFYTVICSGVPGYGEQQTGNVKVKRGNKTHTNFLLEPVQIES